LGRLQPASPAHVGSSHKRFQRKQFHPAAQMALTLLRTWSVQILLGSDSSGAGPPDPRDGFAPQERLEGEQEVLDDFLSRLQSIIGGSPAAPRSADDTHPSRRRAGGAS
jgi:hypothetical protein